MIVKNFYRYLEHCFSNCKEHNDIINYTGSVASNIGGSSNTGSMLSVWSKMATIWSDGNSNGVMFGDGTAEVEFTDYKLSGNIITSLTGTVDMTTSKTDDAIKFEALYTLTNTSESPVTISEIGLSDGYSSPDRFLIERSLLEVPITIEPQGVGQITYVIEFKYSLE